MAQPVCLRHQQMYRETLQNILRYSTTDGQIGPEERNQLQATIFESGHLNAACEANKLSSIFWKSYSLAILPLSVSRYQHTAALPKVTIEEGEGLS